MCHAVSDIRYTTRIIPVVVRRKPFCPWPIKPVSRLLPIICSLCWFLIYDVFPSVSPHKNINECDEAVRLLIWSVSAANVVGGIPARRNTAKGAFSQSTDNRCIQVIVNAIAHAVNEQVCGAQQQFPGANACILHGKILAEQRDRDADGTQIFKKPMD